jgi:hypothetical protein
MVHQKVGDNQDLSNIVTEKSLEIEAVKKPNG